MKSPEPGRRLDRAGLFEVVGRLSLDAPLLRHQRYTPGRHRGQRTDDNHEPDDHREGGTPHDSLARKHTQLRRRCDAALDRAPPDSYYKNPVRAHGLYGGCSAGIRPTVDRLTEGAENVTGRGRSGARGREQRLVTLEDPVEEPAEEVGHIGGEVAVL